MSNLEQLEQVEAIIQQFQEGGARELHVRIGDFEIYLSKDKNGSVSVNTEFQTNQSPAKTEKVENSEVKEVESTSSTTTKKQKPVEYENGVDIVAPYMGTFYRSPAPGTASYVEIGQTVTVDTEVCLVEVMKLFTAVRAGVRGVIKDVFVDDGEMVQAGQLLFVIEENS